MPKNKIFQRSGCLTALFPWLDRLTNDKVVIIDDTVDLPNNEEPLPYRLRDDFLSHAEFSFYKVLLGTLGGQYVILSKVRLADIFFVAQPNENLRFFNFISSKHIDFLVCDSELMKPVFGIELDDSSHNRSDRRERDEFVDQVFNVAGLPIIHFSAKYAYNKSEIVDSIKITLREKTDKGPEPLSQSLPPVPKMDNAPICPRCGIPMVLRVVDQGKYAGRHYYGCKNYPNCKEMKKAD
jgi:hypothetical protein